jgi:hypothetical protein
MGFSIMQRQHDDERPESYDEEKKITCCLSSGRSLRPSETFEGHLHICLGETRLQY